MKGFYKFGIVALLLFTITTASAITEIGDNITGVNNVTARNFIGNLSWEYLLGIPTDFPNSTLAGYNGNFPNTSAINIEGVNTAQNTSIFNLESNDTVHDSKISTIQSNETGYAKLDGSRTVTGSWNWGGFNQTNASRVVASFFEGDGSRLSNLNASNLTGTFNASTDARTNFPNSTVASKEASWDAKTTLDIVNSSAQISRSQVTGQTGVDDSQNTSISNLQSNDTVHDSKISTIQSNETGYAKLDGSRTVTGNWNWGGFNQTNASRVVASFFEGDGSRLSNLNASNLTGTFNAATDARTNFPNSTVASKSAIWDAKPNYLSNLSDVTILTPVTDQVVTWNGVSWINKQVSLPISAGVSTTYYLEKAGSDIAGYEILVPVPAIHDEVQESVTVNNNQTLIDQYATNNSWLGTGVTSIPEGPWEFDTYANVSVADVGNYSEILIDVYKSNSTGGNQTLLFSTSTGLVNTIGITIYSPGTIQPAFAVNTTDRLIVKYTGKTTNGISTTISFYHGGTQHYSHVHIPLAPKHNDLQGLQGCGNDDCQHLTTALRSQVVNQSGVDASQNTSIANLQANDTVHDSKISTIQSNETGYAKLDGSRTVTGSWNWGGFNLTNALRVVASFFEGDGSRLSNLNASNISSGSIAKNVMPANVTYNDSANTFGSFNQSFDTNTLFIDAVNHRVGIGKTNPDEKLSVNGTTEIYTSTGGTAFYVNSTSGNVGIGTASPSNKLDVIGTVNASFLNGDGSNISNINGSKITSGKVNSSFLDITNISSYLSGDKTASGNGLYVVGPNITNLPAGTWFLNAGVTVNVANAGATCNMSQNTSGVIHVISSGEETTNTLAVIHLSGVISLSSPDTVQVACAAVGKAAIIKAAATDLPGTAGNTASYIIALRIG